MTASSEMRDLAQMLLTYEASAVKTSEPLESTVLRVYEKLRQSLGEIAGTAAFYSLASRALAIARSEIPNLQTTHVSADGALKGLKLGPGEFGPQTEIEIVRTGEQPAGDEGIVVITRLLGLLITFLGEPITLGLLRNAWPDAAFGDHSSERGKIA